MKTGRRGKYFFFFSFSFSFYFERRYLLEYGRLKNKKTEVMLGKIIKTGLITCYP